MAIITLITDWGSGNHYAGAVKGALLKQLPDAVIVEITHHIACFDIMQASFVLRNAWPNFPGGSIHLIGINSEGGIDTPHIAVKHQDHFFIGADNGIFSLLFDGEAHQAVELDFIQDSDYFTFSTRDVFVKAAAMLARGQAIEELGPACEKLNERLMFKPVVYPNKIIGKVIFVDNYGNVFVNIDQALFRELGKQQDFMISFRAPGEGISRIHHSYSDVAAGEKVALFGTSNYLEIAINQGKASLLLGLQVNDTVSITFFPKK